MGDCSDNHFRFTNGIDAVFGHNHSDVSSSPPGMWSSYEIPSRECRSPDDFQSNGYFSYGSGSGASSGASSGESSPISPSRNRRPSGSSLKDPTKTPPGTPTRRKSVKFADALGLDLETVRHILTDSVPKVPDCVYNSYSSQQEYVTQDHNRYLAACFSQPSADSDFIRRVHENKVCLENAIVSDLTILGTVKVANIGYHKSVKVRFTTNSWKSYYDIPASYVQGSCDGPTDRFSFGLTTPREFHVGDRLEFAILYDVTGQPFWDSNHGNNYIFECYSQANDSVNDSDALWMHFV
ncbi:glycogen-binding subunit 76A-like isoform X1 [Saccoglossus kowalevskii]|uniref:Glycogen-binding subunit 76A-like n=1 Tax=Saccoglossus kowalevskii TaxID=10224 RepID=A0ABM0GS47_SACKO|nr:PREDICTED: glycogen-binding subunit 76A-like [Saccoglossus kowalevskii]